MLDNDTVDLVDDNETEAEEVSAVDQWYAVLYPQTGALRLYATEGLAATRVARADLLLYGYRSPLDLQSRHDHLYLEKLWLKILKNQVLGLPKSALVSSLEGVSLEPPDCPTDELSTKLWDLMQRVGDRVHRRIAPKRRQRDDYYIDVEKINHVLNADPKGYPRQCRLIAEGMRDIGDKYVTEDRLKRMMLELVASGKLRTKQDHWLIFQFYRKRLIDDGLFSRGEQLAAPGEADDDGEE